MEVLRQSNRVLSLLLSSYLDSKLICHASAFLVLPYLFIEKERSSEAGSRARSSRERGAEFKETNGQVDHHHHHHHHQTTTTTHIHEDSYFEEEREAEEEEEEERRRTGGKRRLRTEDEQRIEQVQGALKQFQTADVPILSVAHCVYPHRWRRLYPGKQWLESLQDREGDIETELRLIDDEGKVLYGQYATRPSRFFHSSVDMVALRLESRELLQRLAQLAPDHDLTGILQTEFELPPPAQPRVLSYGTKVLHSGLAYEWKQASCVPGAISHVTRHQVFVDAAPLTLEEGMCGGPLVTPSGRVVGMLEGIVLPLPDGLAIDSPELRFRQQISGHGAVIAPAVITPFVSDARQHFSLPSLQ